MLTQIYVGLGRQDGMNKHIDLRLYHDCWWHGNKTIQNINNNAIDLEYSCLGHEKAKIRKWIHTLPCAVLHFPYTQADRGRNVFDYQVECHGKKTTGQFILPSIF